MLVPPVGVCKPPALAGLLGLEREEGPAGYVGEVGERSPPTPSPEPEGKGPAATDGVPATPTTCC